MPDKVSMEVVRSVMTEQSLGVLATQGSRYPYTSLVGFAVSGDNREIVFSTFRDTSKYSNIKSNPGVSMLVTSSENRESDFKEAAAVTALGDAREVPVERQRVLRTLYLSKFPFLKDFADDPRCVLMRIEVAKYIVVTSFQHVDEIVFAQKAAE